MNVNNSEYNNKDYVYYYNGEEVSHDYGNGTVSYKIPSGGDIVIYSNNTWHNYENQDTGVCYKLHDGSILIVDSSEKCYLINDNRIQQVVDSNNGEYNFNNGRTIAIKNDSDYGKFISEITENSKFKYFENGSHIGTYGNNTVYYDSNGNELSHDYGDGVVSYKTSDGGDLVLYSNNTWYNYENQSSGSYCTLEDGSIVVVDSNNETYLISNHQIQKQLYSENGEYHVDSDTSVYYDEKHGVVVRKKYNNGEDYYDQYSDGTKLFYGYNGKKVYYDANNKKRAEEWNDVIHYYNEDGSFLTLQKDSNYIYNNDTCENGNYTILDDGSIQVFFENESYVLNKMGGIACRFIGDSVYQYNSSLNQQIKTRNGQTSYSMINHIEYDEDEYNRLLNTLNSLYSSSQSKTKSDINNIKSEIKRLPETYSSSSVTSLGLSISNNLSLIKHLVGSINYSLLAYQTCDENLESELYRLIDSLFGDAPVKMSDDFKKEIKDTVEDRNGDNILEYKKDTNFYGLSNFIMKGKLEREYGLHFLEDEEITDEFRSGLGLPKDVDMLVAQRDMDVNGVLFDSYFVFDAEEFVNSGEDMMNLEDSNIDYFRQSYNNTAHLQALADAGLRYVFDQTPRLDVHSSVNSSGEMYFYGGAWASGTDSIRIHYSPEYNDAYNRGLLLHETGHATDALRNSSGRTNTYDAITSQNYDSGHPMYLRLSGQNDGYIKIEYDENDNPYVNYGNKRIPLTNMNRDGNGWSSGDSTWEISGVTYQVASEYDVNEHCSEVAAEVTRWHYDDQGYLRERMEEDPSYRLVAEDIVGFLSENYGEDNSYIN